MTLRRLDWRALWTYVTVIMSRNLRQIQTCVFVWCLDTSGSMAFGSGDVTQDRICASPGRIAWPILSVQQGDAVGLTCMGTDIVRTIPPRRTPSHLRGLNDVLENSIPVVGWRSG